MVIVGSMNSQLRRNNNIGTLHNDGGLGSIRRAVPSRGISHKQLKAERPRLVMVGVVFSVGLPAN